MLDEETLRARFDLIEIDGEGILLNRESGALYRLNQTAFQIWDALISGRSIPAITDRLVRRFGIEQRQADRDTLAALEEPLPTAAMLSADDRFRWAPLGGGYGFFVDGALVCKVDALANFLRLCEGATPTRQEARVHLKSVVPKLLALRGIRALHAAAVEMDSSLLVFSGASGAGKTTSARAFSQAGARLVTEDLLIFASDAGGADAIVGGEPAIHAWVAREGAQLAAHPEQAIDCTALDHCLAGERRPVKRLLLIDAARRAGESISVEELSRPDALIALLESAYFASADASSWRSSIESLRGLVTAVSTARAIMPKGLAALRAAATAFATTI